MREPVERRLAAILAADVAGYSRLMGADEEGTLERLKAHRRQLVDPKIKEHRGRIVKTTGDGMLVEFPSVVDAVRCAAEIERAMVDRNPETPEDQRITFRIGVNLGDIIVDGDDIYGDGVNIAARLEALAEPGGVCISRVVRDQIRDKLPYPFEDMGEQSVKNIARPVRAFAMTAGAIASTPLGSAPAPLGRARSPRRAVIPASVIVVFCIAIVAWWLWPKEKSSTTSVHPSVPVGAQVATTVANAPPPRLSFVVLPFENLSKDPDQEYFADGITDDLTTDLSRISGSFVIARNTAFTYKGKAVDVKQIGRDLGVRYIIEGSVRRLGDQVQINVQLIDAETGAHVWADRFDTDRANFAEAQREITGRLARSLDLQLLEAESNRIGQDRAIDPDARDLVMRGWARFYRSQSVQNLDEARQAFERALEIDPRSVQARIGIAASLMSKLFGGSSSSVRQDQERAEKLLLEALERDPNNPVAHWTMGMLRRSQNRLTEAKVEEETGITLDRNSRSYAQLGYILEELGEPEAAIPNLEKAIRLNPHDPNIWAPYAGLGVCQLLLSHVDQAIDLLTRARAANPRIWIIHFWIAGAFGLQGKLAEAKAALAEALQLKPEVNSLAAYRTHRPWDANPQFTALADKTLYAGLRRAGFPDE